MTPTSPSTNHESFQMRPGRRTRLPIMIAVHSTALGPAIGGLRIRRYSRSADGIWECLRLSEAMTMKAAAIANGTGGGQTVVALPMDCDVTRTLREALLLDVAEQVHGLAGAYRLAPDLGSGPEDMDAIYCRTPYVCGRTATAIATGGASVGTALGVDSAIRTSVREVLQVSSVAGVCINIIGLGSVGSCLARTYAGEGARLIVSDIDVERRALADELGATWLSPEAALLARCDVLAPCALGGLLTIETVDRLECRIVCGAADNQLATDEVAGRLADREIVYVPDFVANAGSLMIMSHVECRGASASEAATFARDSMAGNIRLILNVATQTRANLLEAARRIARERLWEGDNPAR